MAANRGHRTAAHRLYNEDDEEDEETEEIGKKFKWVILFTLCQWSFKWVI